MMPIRLFWWDVAGLLLCLAGFALLALASEREGQVLLGREGSVHERRLFRLLGWPLLAIGLAWSVAGWRGNFGPFLWFGWLTVAALAVVFAISYWPWRARPPLRPARAPRGQPQAAGAVLPSASGALGRRVGQAMLVVALVALPWGFAVALYQSPQHPLLRADAVQGQVGPWTFTLAEEEQEPPEDTPSGVRVKHIMLRFCDACDADIRAAYLKLRPPRLPLALGERFVGERWEREATVAIPAGIRPDEQFWLTVVDKEGRSHQVALDVALVSPATAQFIQEKAR